ncbi:MAG: glycosyltransferase family 1 protein [Parcubacteria group bacterium]|jgi:glycosyltransferase involved in cell wall biosynthesis
MRIGIDGSRAFLAQRTGIEEYSYQVIKHLVNKLEGHEVILYVKKNQSVDFELPGSWKIKVIGLKYLWTQVGLSYEMLCHPVNTLFIPAHTVPIIHSKNTVVAIHGLEYEFVPAAYSLWARLYMRATIRMSCQWAKKIISVSENTKKDLMALYRVAEDKIQVVYEGYSGKFQSNLNDQISKPFMLFVGRLEERKNIVGIIKSFEILKEHYKITHRLILAGKFGYGAEKIQEELKNTNCGKDIILPGFVSEEEKWKLLKDADVFLFPTFYEGFGIPILEAQSVGCPVVASNNSSVPEIAGVETDCNPSLLLVDPLSAEAIADVAYKLLSDKTLRDDIIQKGYENVKRFSWEKCAAEIAEVLK